MQSMDSLEPTQNKVLFKKRQHRPWNTLPTAAEKEAPLSETTSPLSVDFSQTILENTASSSVMLSDKLLIGGFSFSNTPVLNEPSILSNESKALEAALKNKELEIQSLSANLKIASALEHAEKTELARQKEELKRKMMEEKLSLTQQKIHSIELALQKTKERLAEEETLKQQEITIKKTLEGEIKQLLKTLEANETTLLELSQNKKDLEQALVDNKLTAEKSIKDSFHQFVSQEKRIEASFEERMAHLEKQHQESLRKINLETDRKLSEKNSIIQALEEKHQEAIQRLHDDFNQQAEGLKTKIAELQQNCKLQKEAKEEAHKWNHKFKLANEQLEEQKNEIAEKLKMALERNHFQSEKHKTEVNRLTNQIQKMDEKITDMAVLNREGKEALQQALSKLNLSEQSKAHLTQTIEQLNKNTQHLQKQLDELLSENNILTQKSTDILGTSKKLKTIAENERRLRLMLEAKLNGTTTRALEENQKILEHKIVALSETIGRLESEKSDLMAEQEDTVQTIKQLEMSIHTEKETAQQLKEKNKAISSQLFDLEQCVQKETEQRSHAEQRLENLSRHQKTLEEEKSILIRKYHDVFGQFNDLKLQLDAANANGQHLEKTVSFLIKKQDHLEEERTTLEEKYQQVIARLSEVTPRLSFEKKANETLSETNKHLKEDKRKLEEENKNLTTTLNKTAPLLNDQTKANKTLIRQNNALLEEKNELSLDKANLMQKNQELLQKAIKLEAELQTEKTLRTEAERLKTMAETAQKEAQSKLSLAIETANKTVLHALQHYAISTDSNAET